MSFKVMWKHNDLNLFYNIILMMIFGIVYKELYHKKVRNITEYQKKIFYLHLQ